MYAKFRLELKDENAIVSTRFLKTRYLEVGKKLFVDQKRTVKESLEKYLNADGILEAERIEKDWFPVIDAQVFLSHSHRDETLVTLLAGFLYDQFHITSFIDSAVWGYSDDLLRQIDNAYCQKEKTVKVKNNWVYTDSCYSYMLRNQSTAHVHMLLQGALAKMIDRTECLVFVNTPASLNVSDIGNKETTSSPWIYNELLMACTFPPRVPKRYVARYGKAQDSILTEETTGFLKIQYPVTLTKFKELEINDLVKAKRVTYGSHKYDDEKMRRNVEPIKILHQLYIEKGVIKPNFVVLK